MRSVRLSVVLTFVWLLAVATATVPVSVVLLPACETMHVATVPNEVRAVVALRSATLAQVEADLTAGKLDHAAFAQVLDDDAKAWNYLREHATGWTAPADFAASMQVQEVGTKVAAEKVRAGEFTLDQEVRLTQELHRAWAAVDTYFKPEN